MTSKLAIDTRNAPMTTQREGGDESHRVSVIMRGSMDSRREGEHEGSQVSQVPESNDSRVVEVRVSIQNLEADQQVA